MNMQIKDFHLYVHLFYFKVTISFIAFCNTLLSVKYIMSPVALSYSVTNQTSLMKQNSLTQKTHIKEKQIAIKES